MQQGLLSISKTNAVQGGDFVSIRVITADGGEGIQVKVSMENFAQALFGMIHQPCEFTLDRKSG